MWGRKAKRIADLQRAVRVSDGKLADATTDLRALRADVRAVALSDLDAITSYQQRLKRALRACASYWQELDRQARVTRRLADTLLDSVGSKGEHLLPVERELLGIEDKEPAT